MAKRRSCGVHPHYCDDSFDRKRSGLLVDEFLAFLLGRRSRTFCNNDNLICFAAGKQFPTPTRPLHLDAIVGSVIAEADVYARLVLRKKAGTGLDFTRDVVFAREDLNTRTNGASIYLRSHAPD